jgi:UDP-glucose 4-epimerase
VTITDEEMTRFLLSLNSAVDTVFAAVKSALPGEIYVPQVPAARIIDLAKVLINGKDIPIKITGIRPGEKLHELLVSEEERGRTIERDGYYVISPMLPELQTQSIDKPALDSQYSSSDITLDDQGLKSLIKPYLDKYKEG